MPPLVVPRVARFTIHGTLAGRPWAMIQDFEIIETPSGARHDPLHIQATVINQGLAQTFWPHLSNSCVLTKTSWVDLDSLDGDTGETSESAGGAVLPLPGSSAVDALPANAAILITKQVEGGRRARKGRNFLPGLTDNAQTGNNISGSAIADFEAACTNYFAYVNRDGEPAGGGVVFTSIMQVVHQAKDGTVSSSTVSDLQCDSVLATQRRRLRG